MTKAERVKAVLALLDEHYGTEYICYLNYETPWQLLIAVILSAQCTDARVNLVTADLFQKYDTLEKFACADQAELEKDIHSTGFYRMKAKNIISCTRDLVEKYDGQVPKTLEELTGLAGVGRKTANVIRGNIYHEPSVVVDTHVKRISKKLGFAKSDDPEKVEYELMKVLPKDHWILYNIHIITLGRSLCTARNPRCEECFLREVCPSRRAEGEGKARSNANNKARSNANGKAGNNADGEDKANAKANANAKARGKGRMKKDA